MDVKFKIAELAQGFLAVGYFYNDCLTRLNLEEEWGKTDFAELLAKHQCQYSNDWTERARQYRLWNDPKSPIRNYLITAYINDLDDPKNPKNIKKKKKL